MTPTTNAHHDRVTEAAQHHDQRQYAIHDADPLVID
jgi:hypothetical protein